MLKIFATINLKDDNKLIHTHTRVCASVGSAFCVRVVVHVCVCVSAYERDRPYAHARAQSRPWRAAATSRQSIGRQRGRQRIERECIRLGRSRRVRAAARSARPGCRRSAVGLLLAPQLSTLGDPLALRGGAHKAKQLARHIAAVLRPLYCANTLFRKRARCCRQPAEWAP